jgi:hypothetical protein
MAKQRSLPKRVNIPPPGCSRFKIAATPGNIVLQAGPVDDRPTDALEVAN